MADEAFSYQLFFKEEGDEKPPDEEEEVDSMGNPASGRDYVDEGKLEEEEKILKEEEKEQKRLMSVKIFTSRAASLAWPDKSNKDARSAPIAWTMWKTSNQK